MPHEFPCIWHIAAYIRLSREDGNDESLSISNQKKIIKEYLASSFPDPFQFERYYVDDGLSGTDYDRPGFQRMLCDMESGKINCIICKNLSRMFRNYADQGYFLERVFPMYRIRFLTIGEPKIDSFLNPGALQGLEVPISGLMNDRYAAKTSEDIRTTLACKRKKGEFVGAFAPYGYKKSPFCKNELIIDTEAAQIVSLIYHWFLFEGMSKNAIAKRLNAMGVPNPSSYKKRRGFRYQNPQTMQNDGLWSPSSVSYILKNEIYTGTMVQGRQRILSYKIHKRISVPKEQWDVVSNTHTAIIEKALFQKAQKQQAHPGRVAPSRHTLHLFSGLLFCADCQKAMTRQRTKNHVYYYCRTYRDKSNAFCTKHTIKESVLETAVHTFLRTLLSESELKVRRDASEAKAMHQAIISCQKELNKTERVIDGLYDDFKSELLSKEEYLRIKKTYQARILYLSQSIETNAQLLASRKNMLPESSSDPFLNRRLFLFLFKRILVQENGGLIIECAFRSPANCVLHLDMKQLPPSSR